MHIKSTKKLSVIIFLLLLVLSACTENNSNITPTNEDQQVTQTATFPEPTATEFIEPTQQIKNLLIFKQGSDEIVTTSQFEEISAKATELGYQVSISEDLPDTSNNYLITLAFTEDEEILNQLSSITKDRLVIIAEDFNQPSLSNYTFIQVSKAKQIFLAGYFAALITDDWRVGGLLPKQTINNTDTSTIFSNGVTYLCGRCVPVYGPIVNFPVTATLSVPEDTAATMQSLGEISSNRINSLFIPGEYLYDDLVILLRQNEVTIISDAASKNMNSDWVDYVVTNNLSDLLVDILSTESGFADSNEELVVDYLVQSNLEEIPLGRKNFLQETIENLKSGLISPYEISNDGP